MLSVAACIGQWKWVYYRSKARKLEDFDTLEEAARGPYGSLLLLFKIPWGGLATLGAVVTILALGIDTFAQQVISRDTITIWVDEEGSAAFSLANNYSGGAQMAASGSPWVPDRQWAEQPT